MQGVSNIDYKSNLFTYNDGSSGDQKTFTVFQYCNSTCSLEDTNQKLTDHYTTFGATDIEILRTFTWPYFPRWNIKDAEKGRHWDLYNLQGVGNVWIIGGGTIFESVRTVMGYNQLLIENMVEPLPWQY